MVLSLLCGVSFFLFGMSLMGDGLKSVAGNKLEAFLYKMTNTPLKGVALGTGVTSVIQSSSATTVMVIGFVNSGMMKLKQDSVSVLYPGLRWNCKYSFYSHYFSSSCCNRYHASYGL